VWKLWERGKTVQELVWKPEVVSSLGKGRLRIENENKVGSSDYSVVMNALD